MLQQHQEEQLRDRRRQDGQTGSKVANQSSDGHREVAVTVPRGEPSAGQDREELDQAAQEDDPLQGESWLQNQPLFRNYLYLLKIYNDS